MEKKNNIFFFFFVFFFVWLEKSALFRAQRLSLHFNLILNIWKLCLKCQEFMGKIIMFMLKTVTFPLSLLHWVNRKVADDFFVLFSNYFFSKMDLSFH